MSKSGLGFGLIIVELMVGWMGGKMLFEGLLIIFILEIFCEIDIVFCWRW